MPAALGLCLLAAGGGCGKSTGAGGLDTATELRPVAVAPSVTPVPAAPAGSSAQPPTTPATVPPSSEAGSPKRPPIVESPIPFGAKREAEMKSYAERHYGIDTYSLIDPHVIVIHYTVTPSFRSTFNTFAPDVPDPELHELPNTCAHYVVDSDGTIHQLVSIDIMCRHTVGLNWTAIGIEHVGYSDAQVLGDRRQMNGKPARWCAGCAVASTSRSGT